MAITYVKRADIKQNFVNGFAQEELLPGTYDMIKNYKCTLKAGHDVSPKQYGDKVVALCFTSGTGYLTTDKWAENIDELCFFCPDFDKGSYSIHAVTDMEFLIFVCDQTELDWKQHEANHTRLPYFVRMSQSREYVQDCKGPNTQSWSILGAKHVGRIMIGVVKGYGEGEGTVEKGHPAVHQWNYCLPGADFTIDVDGEKAPHRDGDWSFVPAGPDHSLVSGPGQLVYYIWFEHFVKEFLDD